MHLYEIQQPMDRQELEKNLSSFFSYLTMEDNLKPKYIAKQLKQTLKHLGVGEITVDYVDQVDPGDMNLNATYDPWDDEDELDPYRIELLFNPKDKNGVKFSQDALEEIKHRLIDALEHEMIHSLQYQKRDFKTQKGFRSKNREQEYLGNQDEIEAFAKNISSELLRHANKEQATDMLRSVNNTTELRDKLGNLLSPNLVGYLRAWDFNTRHPVIKKLLKKVYNYIQNS
jgi:aryl-alcohol dehydrogenase-like predicted oxidoreductase